MATKTINITKLYHPVKAIIGFRASSDMCNPFLAEYEKSSVTQSLMCSIVYPKSEIAKRFQAEYNLTDDKFDTLRSNIDAVGGRIRKLKFDFGSTHRRDYWAMFLKKFYPGTQQTLNQMAKDEDEYLKVQKILEQWCLENNIKVQFPKVQGEIPWVFEPDHEYRIIQKEVVEGEEGEEGEGEGEGEGDINEQQQDGQQFERTENENSDHTSLRYGKKTRDFASHKKPYGADAGYHDSYNPYIKRDRYQQRGEKSEDNNNNNEQVERDGNEYSQKKLKDFVFIKNSDRKPYIPKRERYQQQKNNNNSGSEPTPFENKE
ncbi:hypothetical protein DFA_02671 [Cavenderia fasciculata]|uniref:Uncharacterized protein n=1 Tax=Cavenderia fasciculata TaxID=261658 RepID=F4Q017_CACFS|nr:uncharacterized protein DFA_02671 [Cavenderia fasciculata]EGG18931.1 hypothetical protein DFA_02671 [Cavenderia fasciculata]|eukprot:XP_004357393.1 hypothetical protein DFA_02671 [Cavenderia fasciculata]